MPFIDNMIKIIVFCKLGRRNFWAPGHLPDVFIWKMKALTGLLSSFGYTVYYRKFIFINKSPSSTDDITVSVNIKIIFTRPLTLSRRFFKVFFFNSKLKFRFMLWLRVQNKFTGMLNVHTKKRMQEQQNY